MKPKTHVLFPEHMHSETFLPPCSPLRGGPRTVTKASRWRGSQPPLLGTDLTGLICGAPAIH